MLDACSPVFWFGSLAGFGACLILLWAVDSIVDPDRPLPRAQRPDGSVVHSCLGSYVCSIVLRS